MDDVIYMDPPYQGTSFTRDHGGVSYDEFVEVLQGMNDRGVSYIISYDGRTGDKKHGRSLPSRLSFASTCISALVDQVS